jgi:hypothetical protein
MCIQGRRPRIMGAAWMPGSMPGMREAAEAARLGSF